VIKDCLFILIRRAINATCTLRDIIALTNIFIVTLLNWLLVMYSYY